MSRLGSYWAALQQRLDQSVVTRSDRQGIVTTSRDVDRVDLANDAADWYDNYDTTPLVRASIDKFASDVVEPGYRIEGEDDEAIDYLMDTWLPQAAVVGPVKHNDFLPFLRLGVIQRWTRGGLLTEHVRPDPQSDQFTGLKLVRPETVTVQTQDNRNILLDPEADGSDVVTTARDEAAAYIQFHEEAPLGPFSDKEPVPLSLNDVTVSLLDPDIDDTWGTPVTATIDDDLTGFKNILRDQEEAIKTKAYGIWSIAFGRDTIEHGDGTVEIIEWSDDDQQDFVDAEIDDMGPGEIVSHDGEISFEKFEPDVPELIDHLEFYVNNITTALPSPKYVVGFEKNINQFVTERQDERYERLIQQERQALQRTFTPLLKEVAERNLGIEDPDIQLVLEPEPDESPVMSLEADDIDSLKTYAEALDLLAGPTQGPGTLVQDETLRELLAQLPEDAEPEDEPALDESDENVEAQFDAAFDGDG